MRIAIINALVFCAIVFYVRGIVKVGELVLVSVVWIVEMFPYLRQFVKKAILVIEA